VISGAFMWRPGIEKLQRDARAGRFEIVLSEAMDRLSRRLLHISRFHELMEHLTFASTSTNPGPRFDHDDRSAPGHLRRSFATLAGKTVRGQRGRARKGKSAGGNSYGYDVLPGVEVQGVVEHGDRAINPQEAAVVRRIFEGNMPGSSPRRLQ